MKYVINTLPPPGERMAWHRLKDQTSDAITIGTVTTECGKSWLKHTSVVIKDEIPARTFWKECVECAL